MLRDSPTSSTAATVFVIHHDGMRVGRWPHPSLVRSTALLNPFEIFCVFVGVVESFLSAVVFLFRAGEIPMTKTLIAVDGWLPSCFLSRLLFLEFVAEIRSLFYHSARLSPAGTTLMWDSRTCWASCVCQAVVPFCFFVFCLLRGLEYGAWSTKNGQRCGETEGRKGRGRSWQRRRASLRVEASGQPYVAKSFSRAQFARERFSTRSGWGSWFEHRESPLQPTGNSLYTGFVDPWGGLWGQLLLNMRFLLNLSVVWWRAFEEEIEGRWGAWTFWMCYPASKVRQRHMSSIKLWNQNMSPALWPGTHHAELRMLSNSDRAEPVVGTKF